jgi:hypothetical protein
MSRTPDEQIYEWEDGAAPGVSAPFAFGGVRAAQHSRSRAVQLGCDRVVATPKYVIVEE